MEKKVKIHLTNEEIRKKFKNNFDLVNYAIQLAENMVKTGRDSRVKSDIQNRAMLIIEEIREGKDLFDEIKESEGVPGMHINGIAQPKMIHEEYHTEKKKVNLVEVNEIEE